MTVSTAITTRTHDSISDGGCMAHGCSTVDGDTDGNAVMRWSSQRQLTTHPEGMQLFVVHYSLGSCMSLYT